jgi:hypothetical protein
MLNASGVHDQGSITAEPAEEMRAERGMPGAPQSRAFYPFVTAGRASKLQLIS